MKRLLSILLILFSSVCYAQNLTISVSSELAEDVSDLDAKVYFPKHDRNDNLCALIKVRLINELKNPLVLEVGGLGVVAREEKESGEVWFYVPAQVKNLSFLCAGYTAPPQIPAVLKEGTVFRITLNPDAVYETITNAVLSTNYLKFSVNEPNAVISLGKTKDYELITQNIKGKDYAELLNFGTYYFRIEHPLYETYEGKVTLDNSTPKQVIALTPAYSYLEVKSSPSGATVYLDDNIVGTTPYTASERVRRGETSLRLDLPDYYTVRENVIIEGKGATQTVNYTLKPRFAMVTLECPDKEAEIWIDEEMVGKGRWSGRMSSVAQHFVETRRAGHHSRATRIFVVDGETKTVILEEPLPLYGALNIVSEPMGCELLLDGEIVGETPYIGQVLVGEHSITLLKEGYMKATFPITIEHNQTAIVEKTLEKGYTVEELCKRGDNCYYGRNGYVQDYTKAVEWYLEAAKQGSAEAQYQLGCCYVEGLGVQQNANEAVVWWRHSAIQGHREAQYELGDCYYIGKGVTKNLKFAVDWYKSSAEQGNAAAQYSLGFCYYNNQGVVRDYKEAVNWFTKSSEQGNAKAQYYLGICYKEGNGVLKDASIAAKWFLKSAENGYVVAQKEIAECYRYNRGISENNNESVKWYRKAAEQGDADAQYAMGYFYYTGGYYGLTKNRAEAIKWYRKAADQGHKEAQYVIAECYYDGDGVLKNVEEAVKWYRKAAQNGNSSARRWLERHGYGW